MHWGSHISSAVRRWRVLPGAFRLVAAVNREGSVADIERSVEEFCAVSRTKSPLSGWYRSGLSNWPLRLGCRPVFAVMGAGEVPAIMPLRSDC